MRWIRYTVIFLIILLLLLFVVQNVGQPVKLVFFNKANPIESEMIIVLLITLIIGVIVGFLFSVLRVLAIKNQHRIVSTECKRLKGELDALRNVDIEETGMND